MHDSVRFLVLSTELLPTQHHVQIATCVQPHGETPVAFTRAIASDTLEHFGTLEAMAGWNFLEHLKLRGLNQSLPICDSAGSII